MARYIGAICRLCRREGMKLFLKGNRCYTDKCVFARGSYTPRQHGAAKKEPSNYGVQLGEKRKVRRIYGVLENQFRAYCERADHMKSITGENLLRSLEMGLDNVVYRLGYGASRAETKQLTNRGHFLINDKRVGTPSYRVSVNDEVIITKENRGAEKFKTFIKNPKTLPKWLKVNVENYSGEMVAESSGEDIDAPANETPIIELYSK